MYEKLPLDQILISPAYLIANIILAAAWYWLAYELKDENLVSLKAFIGMCVTGMLIFVGGLHIPLWLVNPFWPSYYFGGFIMSILFTYSIVKEKIR
jgi:hypothetical protein